MPLIEKAVLIENRTLVPAPFITKVFNVTMNWDKEEDQLNYESSFTIPVLMYHHFMKGEASSIITDPEVFKEQLSYLKEQGYTTIMDHDLLAYLTEGILLPEKPLLITMDDGYTSNYTAAFPILKELNMKATIYVVVNTVGKLLDKYPHFTWEEAKEMYDSGLVEIQSHTFDSHKKAKVDGVMKPLLVSPIPHGEKLETEKEYKERVYNDLSQSKQLIEQHVGNKVVTLSFPYGVSNETAVELGKKAGYEVMMTIAPGLNHKEANRFQLLRINVDGHDSGKDIEEHISQFVN
ncbi:polysaccharide deacetylase family protein [Bacillus taeanensis]|uniref:Chitin deacetylase n=1 Tax=Bacillus taeanensis TaxID=273032 RepID=A0A366XN90_9BACI|nr:polysaccharide deacetylase family protein [Bacillus taeanensis]RBW67592.1 chitin deacetylase [Bacillus taeanensis]